ncbi:hypothetical protein HI914_01892 [Erysiphe necator]|nr:hypothetical protein HI914_01892 [Erysiphe necator]
MDRALDEIVAERYKGNRFQGRRSDHGLERKFYSRYGIRKVHTPPLLHFLYT